MFRAPHPTIIQKIAVLLIFTIRYSLRPMPTIVFNPRNAVFIMEVFSLATFRPTRFWQINVLTYVSFSFDAPITCSAYPNHNLAPCHRLAICHYGFQEYQRRFNDGNVSTVYTTNTVNEGSCRCQHITGQLILCLP